ncbi:hypothetical protein A4G99_09685 [Haladaptatus sp. R4]|uniref:EMC6-like membrane protein n=1 Tax=Haladaptatus sp. R4 TaxID=1679489 RepID=UPI0007B49288|nr:hypothetical protein [Haladaptatus sp. R4]KZN24618.1 hypothetical protein A4G99_09685 [Haladaptatus sp. R4]
MATEKASEQRASHLRSITITSLASIAGIIAGVASAMVAGTTATAAKDQMGLVIMLAFVVVQLPLLYLIGYELDGVKDALFVAFMTFSLWFITWGILLINQVRI